MKNPFLLFIFVILSLNVCAQATDIEDFEKIVGVQTIKNPLVENAFNLNFITDVTYPKGYSKLERFICKYVYGYSNSNLRNVIEHYAEHTVNNKETLKGVNNLNWLFCMGYQKDRFFSYLSLVSPYTSKPINWMQNVQTGIFNLKNNKPLRIEDIFTENWLSEYTEINDTVRLMILPDWTLVVMNKNIIANELGTTGTSYQTIITDIFPFWLKTYNLKELKEHLNPSFLELVDFDSDPIAVEPHIQDNQKARALTADVLSKFILNDTE